MKPGKKHLLVKLTIEAFSFSKQYLTIRFNLAENTGCYLQRNIVQCFEGNNRLLYSIWAE